MRRTRCALCHQLVAFTVEFWPRGLGYPPRRWVCEHCARDLGVTGERFGGAVP